MTIASLFFLQNSSRELEPPIKYPAGNGKSIDIGDLNNDGRADAVVSSYNGIGVFLQSNSGGLNPMVTYSSNPSPFSTLNYSVKIGDFNSDGLLDVVSAVPPNVDIFLQNTSGTLNQPVSYSVASGYDLDVGDVNSDGLQDIVLISRGPVVLLQKTDGTFGSPVYYDLGENKYANGVAVGDINGDTLQDIVVTYGGNRPNSFIGVFLQNNSGTLNPAISYPSHDIPKPVEIGDVNSDGRNDIIVAHDSWLSMGVYLQNSSGGLNTEQLFGIPYAGYNPHGLAVGDIDGDGAKDVAVADYNNGLVILYNTIPLPPSQLPLPPAFGITDTSVQWGNAGLEDIPIVGDFNEDGSDDVGIFRPSAAQWYFNWSFTSVTDNFINWGLPGDHALVLDLDGDGIKSDLGIFRPSTGRWYFNWGPSYDSVTDLDFQWGMPRDTPLVGDFDGDGTSDVALRRSSTAQWFFNTTFTADTSVSFQWGSAGSGDIPIVGDFDGDSADDVGIFRAYNSYWNFKWDFTNNETNGWIWWAGGDYPLTGDFDGDGIRDDISIFRPSTGWWYFNWGYAHDLGTDYYFQWGMPGDTPLVGDFDGDGLSDVALRRFSTAQWFFNWSSLP